MILSLFVHLLFFLPAGESQQIKMHPEKQDRKREFGIHSVKMVQKIPFTIEQAWAFYTNPQDLLTITPSSMKFSVIAEHHAERLYIDQVFEYKVSPIFGIPLNWVSEIKEVNAPVYFMDEQRKGPYKFWQHQHYFKAIEGGVEVTDIIYYKNPLGILGTLANILFIKKKLRKIFEYRFKRIEELFGKWPGGQSPLIEIV